MDTEAEALVIKMQDVEREAAEKYGNFTLFALLEREDTTGLWDVVVSASWLKPDREGILIIAQYITSLLAPEQTIQISQIIPMEPNSDFVQFIQSFYEQQTYKENKLLKIGPSVLSGIQIRNGYILASAPLLTGTQHLRSHMAAVPV